MLYTGVDVRSLSSWLGVLYSPSMRTFSKPLVAIPHDTHRRYILVVEPNDPSKCDNIQILLYPMNNNYTVVMSNETVARPVMR